MNCIEMTLCGSLMAQIVVVNQLLTAGSTLYSLPVLILNYSVSSQRLIFVFLLPKKSQPFRRNGQQSYKQK